MDVLLHFELKFHIFLAFEMKTAVVFKFCDSQFQNLEFKKRQDSYLSSRFDLQLVKLDVWFRLENIRKN